MSSLTDRAAYLRGLAEGMGLDKEKNENKLMLEMLSVMDDMAQKIAELETNLGELEEYVDDIDTDLADMEEVLFDEDDDGECGCGDDDCDECGDYGDDEELSFDCPNCGKSVMIKAADIDFDESPVCEACGKPFFTDVPEDDEAQDDKNENKDDE
ncbi:MAG: hypothetical protein RR653_01470 [Clostridia bacterium]